MDLIFFNFSEGGNIENERIIEVSQININSSNSEKEKCEFHIETLKKIDVVNNETFFYFEESRELGGVITEYSKSGDVYKYKGKTFRGMIAERYIVPDPGYTHRIFPTAQSAINHCLQLVFPNALMDDNSEEKTGEYSYRYTNCFKAMTDACGDDLRLEFSIVVVNEAESTLFVTIEDTNDLTHILEADTQALDVSYTLSEKDAYNHILALGGGEMLERQVYEMWLHGAEWLESPHTERLITYCYNYGSVEDLEALKRETRVKAKTLVPSNSYEVILKDEALKNAFSVAKLGDTVSLDGLDLVVAEIEEDATAGDMFLQTTFQLGTRTKDVRSKINGDEPLNQN